MAVLGAHESVSGGLHLAFRRIGHVGGEALQIFTRNQRQWAASELSVAERDAFREAHEESGHMAVVSHASYLVNLASTREDVLARSAAHLAGELGRCDQLGIASVVLHPGSHGGDGIEAGLHRLNAGLDLVLAQSRKKVRVLLETTAGQGTGLGSSFEELAYLLESSRFPELLGVCVDTCHVFAAGYDLRSAKGYAAMVDALDGTVGLENVHLFHVNDSKTGLGSRVDRHEHIGKGAIGLAGFGHLLRDPRFAGVPMILETPKGDGLEEDIRNLDILRTLA